MPSLQKRMAVALLCLAAWVELAPRAWFGLSAARWYDGTPGARAALAERVRLQGWRQLTEATRLGDYLRRLLVEAPA